MLFAAACIFGFFGVLFPWFDNLGLLSQSTVAQLQLYITSWVRAVFAVLLFAFLLPECLILRLRLAGIYRGLVQFTKSELAPGLIAFGLVGTGLMFFSHLAFNIEEAFGFVCDEFRWNCTAARTKQSWQSDKRLWPWGMQSIRARYVPWPRASYDCGVRRSA